MALTHGGGNVPAGVVDRLRGAKLTQTLLVVGLHGRDHPRAASGGKLHRVAADAAISADNEHCVGFVWVDRVDRDQRGDASER